MASKRDSGISFDPEVSSGSGSSFDPEVFFEGTPYTETETCWISLEPQGSETWKRLRKKILTASNIDKALGLSQFGEPKEIANVILTGISEEKTNHHMQRGNRLEPDGRLWYEETKGVKVKQVGLAIWKKDPRIGASSDGDLGEGCLEVKAPEHIYPKLLSRLQMKVKKPGYDHIYLNHYLQMLTNTVVLGKLWCDYLVFCPLTDSEDEEGVERIEAYLERIHKNQEEWDTKWYPLIQKFFSIYVDPYRKK